MYVPFSLVGTTTANDQANLHSAKELKTSTQLAKKDIKVETTRASKVLPSPGTKTGSPDEEVKI